jgi:ABC-type polysaccharide/polyol phosphate export permease
VIMKNILMLNPMTAPLDIFRGSLNGQVNWPADVASIACSLILFTVGLVYFRKTEAYFADLS